MVITRSLIIKSITFGVWGPSSLHLFYLLLSKINFRCVNKDDEVDQKYVLERFVTQTNGKIGAVKDLEKSRKIFKKPSPFFFSSTRLLSCPPLMRLGVYTLRGRRSPNPK